MHMTLFYNIPYSVRVVVKKHCITVEIPEKNGCVQDNISSKSLLELIFIDVPQRKILEFYLSFLHDIPKKLVLPVFPN